MLADAGRYYSSLNWAFHNLRRLKDPGNFTSLTGRASKDWKAFSSSQEGDKDAQEVLLEILKLQKQQVEVTEFVKERSEFLKEVAGGASEEYDRIADDMKKGMDEIGSKVMESVEAEVGELEREMAESRAQIEADEREFEQYQKKVADERNKALFFKSLYQPLKKKSKSVLEQQEIREEAKKVAEVAEESASSSSRSVIYAALGILLALTLVEAVVSGEDWYKVAIYSVLLLCLLLQLGYENFLRRK